MRTDSSKVQLLQLCITSQSRLESCFVVQKYSGVGGDVRGAFAILEFKSR